jgi:transcriptional regulator with XRE-family HTH domain
MEVNRLGSVFRAVRVRKGWRQVDIAHAARLSQPVISRIERGHVRRISVATLLRLAEALEVRIDVVPRWRGGDLDRMLNAGHAALHQRVAGLFARTAWMPAPEATFAVYGERGVIDVLAFHPPTGALLVVELKTDLVDVQRLMAAVDRYRRLAPRVARERGWNARGIGVWVVLRDTKTNRRRVREHAAVLRSVFPHDGRFVRRWLREPIGPLAALSFVADAAAGPGAASSSGVRRVRRRGAV